MQRLSLRPTFRYVHEPLAAYDRRVPFVDSSELNSALLQRLQYSDGGAFLLTGFRGVGKTTLVQSLIAQLHESGRGLVLPVFLTVARPMDGTALLIQIVRRLYESLLDLGILADLEPEIAALITLAYSRTSLMFKRSQSAQGESSITGSVDVKVLPSFAPKLGISRKEVRSLAIEASYLAYTEADLEHDFQRIILLLKRGWRGRRRRRWGIRGRQRRGEGLVRPRIFIILDELDKIGESDEGIGSITKIVTTLKSILSLQGVCFIFIGGTDLHDEYLRDLRRGNSVYESTFGWMGYAPCCWNAADQIIASVAMPRNSSEYGIMQSFQRYVSYKGRGVFRKIIQELNSFVTWQYGVPELRFSGASQERIEFYSELEEAVRSMPSRRAPGLLGSEIERDRERLGWYYLSDLIIASAGVPFKPRDLIAGASDVSPHQSFGVRAKECQALLEHFKDNGIVEFAGNETRDLDATRVGDFVPEPEPTYRVSDRILSRLRLLVKSSETEREALKKAAFATENVGRLAADRSALGLPPGLLELLGDRYEVLAVLGMGGMGIVYQGRDKALDIPVAIKIPRMFLQGVPEANARAQREGRQLARLNHPNVSKLIDFRFDARTGMSAIITQLVQGESLRECLNRGPIGQHHAVRIAVKLASALEHIHAAGLVRLDLKPNNVILRERDEPVIIDLGIVRAPSDDTMTELTVPGAIIGTPRYMAPEQLIGAGVDRRADIYALGLILLEMIRGDLPWRNRMVAELREEPELLASAVNDPRFSPKLREIILTATSASPEERYQSPEAMHRELLAAAAELDLRDGMGTAG
jgi:hypothetical protein